MHAVDTSAVRADFYECRTYKGVLFCVVCDSGLLRFDGIRSIISRTIRLSGAPYIA